MDRTKKGRGVSAIFVHAGAGYHRRDSERSHLKVCEGAARAAMTILRNGGSAVDAVEIAIMFLEDNELTNAGYGSNTTIEGNVECDATVVDHLGRSGAVGAVAQVKNPISLARTILDASKEPLSLHRVPPNFLVGPGATDFAYERGLVVLPHDGLISDPARRRWLQWAKELEAADEKQRASSQGANDFDTTYYRRPVRIHPAQLLASSSTSTSPVSSLPAGLNSPRASQRSDARSHLFLSPTSEVRTPTPDRSKASSETDAILGVEQLSNPFDNTPSQPNPLRAGSHACTPMETDSPAVPSPEQLDGTQSNIPDDAEDRISDTVGAIAVDSYGRIAAGSSSGGIGMKHRGRVGPAALNGIGTCVIPVDPSDPDRTCVATVTSGTGEHIATTMAASTCATRVYYSQRKTQDGVFEEVTEDEAMAGMISTDFMEHPGVKVSLCEGSIGIMTVKKTVDGVYFYWAHNTDSFALASMSSDDKKPSSVMSRSNGNGSIAQGGQSVFRTKRS